MKKQSKNPVKNVPPQPETLAIKGDWSKFTEDMKKILGERPKSSSPGPASSS
jgi:hypothetical protein